MAVQSRILPTSEKTDGDAVVAMQRADQDSEAMKEEVFKLQLRKVKAR